MQRSVHVHDSRQDYSYRLSEPIAANMDLDFKPIAGDARSKDGKQIERDPVGSKYLLWP